VFPFSIRRSITVDYSLRTQPIAFLKDVPGVCDFSSFNRVFQDPHNLGIGSIIALASNQLRGFDTYWFGCLAGMRVGEVHCFWQSQRIVVDLLSGCKGHTIRTI
jgi:hypothetical protein